MAFIAAGLGSQEVIAMGAAGASYGFRTAVYFSLGAIPALGFCGALHDAALLRVGGTHGARIPAAALRPEDAASECRRVCGDDHR